MTLIQYLTLLDWAGRRTRKDKVAAISADCAPIPAQLECFAETWVDFLSHHPLQIPIRNGIFLNGGPVM